MVEPIPVTVVTSLDDVLRQSAATAMLCDLPGSVALQHDLGVASGDGLRRVVYDTAGVIENTAVPLDHACLSCALREDVVPTVARLARTARWDRVVLALPATAEPALVVEALQNAVVDRRRVSDLAVVHEVVATVDLSTLLADLFGDDLLAERGIALTPDDRRAVGEVIAHQVEYADLVATRGGSWRDPECREATVLRHLVPGSSTFTDLHELDLAAARGSGQDYRARGTHRAYRRTGAEDVNGVWTLELASWRPVHPARLHDRIIDLAGGGQRSRGRFWLPSRPRAVCGWDGAGGQLSIGTVDRWNDVSRETRLLVTGVDDGQALVREAFEVVLMTDSELARGLSRWEGRDDGFSPWLGDIDEAA